MQRTYSRKGAKRHMRASSEVRSEPTSSVQSRKKRKVEVEVITAESSTSESEHEHKEPIQRARKHISTHRRQSSVGNGSTSTAAVPKLVSQVPTRPVKPVSSNSVKPTSKPASRLVSPDKSIKDLTSLFDFTASPKPTPSNAPRGGIAKRMLRRTQTDTSIPTNNNSRSSTIDHSMIAGPSTPRKLTGNWTEPAIGSMSPPRTPSKLKSSDEISSPAARPPIAAASSIRTYGGKSRSFLVELPKVAGGSAVQSQEADLLQSTSQEDDFEIRESYTELRARWGVDNSEDDPWPPPVNVSAAEMDVSPNSKRKGKSKQLLPPLPPGMMNDLKSITELRSKGETRRFLDDMGYLFEGLDPKGAIGVRRGSALEIVIKLCNLEFARKAKAADFLEKAWEALRDTGAGNGDKVLDTILVFFASLAARDPRDLPDLASKSDFVSILFKLLGSWDRENDPLWLISCGLSDAELKKAGISKAEKLSLTSLHKLVRKKSAIFDTVDIVCNRLLASHALSSLPPTTYTLPHCRILLQTLSAEVQPLPSRVSAYTSGLPLFQPLSALSHSINPSLLHVDNCLRLLDSFLLGRWTSSDNADDSPTIIDALKQMSSEEMKNVAAGFKALCVIADIFSRESNLDPDSEQIENRTMYLESLLRVLINLTHDNPVWCQYLVSDPLVPLATMRITMLIHRQHLDAVKKKDDDKGEEELDEESDSAAQLLDRLCLLLGLLTNLVQTSEEAKQVLRTTQLNPQCPGKRTCTSSCRCPSRITAIQNLVQLYTNYADTQNPVELMLRGHVAILLGLLMHDDEENQSIILAALPQSHGQSSNKTKLTGLVENAKEFAEFYTEFARKVSSAVVEEQDDGMEMDGVDEEEGEMVRGVNVSRVLKDSQGECVAKDVIRYLEGLKNNVDF